MQEKKHIWGRPYHAVADCQRRLERIVDQKEKAGSVLQMKSQKNNYVQRPYGIAECKRVQ
jgi:hypothetical protein